MDGRFTKKNVVGIAVLCGVLLIGAAIIVKYQQGNSGTRATLTVNAENFKNTASKTASIDSDGDGLKDWEEVLLKTDPKNPDTDGDGTPDKAEIDAGRDPLVAGPNDKSVAGDSASIDQSRIDALPETDKLAFKLFQGYIDLKKSGSLDATTENNLVSGLLQNNVTSITATTYTSQDVHTSSTANATAYHTALTSAFKPLFNVTEDEIVTFSRIIDNGDKTGFDKLRYAKKQYDAAVALMLAIDTPEDAVAIHVDLLNALSFFAQVLNTMATVGNDPLVVATAIKGYKDGDAKVTAAFGRLNTYLLANGVKQ